MRRIIERKVTVVTTTTWTITWQDAPPQADSSTTPGVTLRTSLATDLASKPSPGLELLQRTSQRPTTVETKEVDVSEIKDIDESVSE